MSLVVPKCAGCPFPMQHTIGTRGPIDSPFVIVGEGPGRDEIRPEFGVPFVGESGTVLDYALQQAAKYGAPEPFITNAIKCYVRADDKDIPKLKQGIDACAHDVHGQISLYPRKLILALGNGALWSLTGDSSLKITQTRGKLFSSSLAEHGILAAVHPAFLLRGGGSFRQFKADVDYACSLAAGGSLRSSGSSTFSVLETVDDLNELAFRFTQVEEIACDLETTGFSFLSDRILCAGFSYDGKHVYVVPEHLIPYMGVLFKNKARFIWHNGKFDVRFLWQAGMWEARVDEDTMLESYANEEKGGIHDLEQVAGDWVYSPNWKAMLKKHLPKRNMSFENVPRPILHEYMSYDVANTFNVHQILRPKISGLATAEKLYTKTLIPASKYLAKVEMTGMAVDYEFIKSNRERLGEQVEVNKAKLIAIANDIGPGEFTDKLANSPKQLQHLLYDKLGFKPKGKKKDKKPTDDDALESMLNERPNHPVIIDLRKYRKVAKAKSTYVDIYYDRHDKKGRLTKPSVVDKDGKVHSTFLIHGTPTGRLASRAPNVQNVPRDPLIRGQYVAPSGRILLEADLNQAELRSLAVLSQDPELCRIYETEGMSLHEEVRRDIYGDPKEWSEEQVVAYLSEFALPERFSKGEDRIVGEQKMRAKAVNFGIVYGRTAPSLAEEFEMDVSEGQRWIDAWFKRFSQAKKFIDVCRRAPALGFDLVTPFGMRKRHPLVSKGILHKLENEAANFPHQSIAAHITLHAGIEIQDRLKEEFDSHIVNTVHDSILVDAPAEAVMYNGAARLLIETLESVPREWGLTRIPFKADAKKGERWGYLKGWDPFAPIKEAT